MVLDENASSIESALSLYEALTGDVVEKVDFVSKPSGKKSKTKIKSGKKGKKKSKASKSSKGSGSKLSKKSSKGSKKSSSRKSSKTSTKKGRSKEKLAHAKEVEAGEVEVGVCVLDLLPFTFGKFEESHTR